MTRVMAGMPAQGFPAPPKPERGPIPRVVGLRSNEAQAKLADAHFSSKVVKVASVKRAGTVINQEPNPGTSAVFGSLVTLTVSSGKAPQVVVPDLVGHTVGFATAKLENVALVAKVVYQTVTDHSKDGKVLKQDVAAGSKVDKGSTVTLTVGRLHGGGATADFLRSRRS